jgi:hypothetical protein
VSDEGPRTKSVQLRRALLVGVGVAAISLATAAGALATTMIGNIPPWNGSTITTGFGVSGPPITSPRRTVRR